MARRQEHHVLYARVNRVLDGDTLVVESGPLGFRVRVADCNTPERGRENWHEATEFTKERVLGQWVGIAHRNQQWDRYGRLLGVVWFGKDYERSLAQELLDAGLAVEDPTTAVALMPDSYPLMPPPAS